MTNRERVGVEEEKSIYIEEWRIENWDNPVKPWCVGSWTWKEIEGNGVSNKKLLVARSNKEC